MTVVLRVRFCHSIASRIETSQHVDHNDRFSAWIPSGQAPGIGIHFSSSFLFLLKGDLDHVFLIALTLSLSRTFCLLHPGQASW